MSSIKPWREAAIPHEDVRKGNFVQAEFAADISRVHVGTDNVEYQEPTLFFERTFITEGMAALLTSVAQRLVSGAGDPVIQLQTAFGGGKTHTLLAVMHLVSGVPASELPGVPDLLKKAGLTDVPQSRVVVLDGIKLSPSQPRQVEGATLHTLWGELAWQLGGAAAYACVAEADASGTSPGKETLGELLREHSPCVILVDELVAYLRQFEDKKRYAGGSYDSNLSFVQALTEGIKAAPNAVLLASLPESDREAGSDRGIRALHTLEHYFGRIQAIWKPVGTEESFEIVRRRLFSSIDGAAADASCDAFARLYVQHADTLPGEAQEARYRERLRKAYPIHPEVFARLYEDWSTLANFQRTRGVLKLMAQVIYSLWQEGNQDALLLPGSLPLHEDKVRSELTAHLVAGWDPVLERDVDGERSEPAELDAQEPRFGAVQAARRVARTVFLGSAPGSSNQSARGLETERIVLGCLQPGQQPHVYRDALGRLETRLTYLNRSDNRWWLDVRPNLRREMEERKKRFEPTEVLNEVRSALQRVMGTSALRVHLFTPAADVPDEWGLGLVVLPPDQAWARSGNNPARNAAAQILRNRGEQPRQKQNRLLFLAADADQVRYLRDTVRALMAWRSMESDARELRMTLDNLQLKQVGQYREQTQQTVSRLVREAYKWLLAPVQSENRRGGISDVEWEAHSLNPANVGLAKEIDRVCEENELVIRKWAPIHLRNLLRRWFWKEDVPDVSALEVWQKSCQYLYLPRLASSEVMLDSILEGAASQDYFGLATDRENGKYLGFSFGNKAAVYMDALLLIDPSAAAEYMTRTAPSPAQLVGGSAHAPLPPADMNRTDATGAAAKPTSIAPEALTRYFGTAELDPVRAAVEFAKIQNELIGLFASGVETTVRVRIDIEAENPSGFDEIVIRAVRENASVLGVDGNFESGQ